MNSISLCAKLTIISLFVIAGCSADKTPEATTSADNRQALPAVTTGSTLGSAEFTEFLQANYAVDMERAPYTASYRGIKDRHDQWNSAAEQHFQQTRELNEARLDRLNAFQADQLSDDLQLSLALYRADLQRQIASDDFRHHKFIIQQFRGPHTAVAANLINIHTVANVADARAYIGRLENVATWFDQVIEQLRIREQKNLLLTDWQYPQIIESANNVISGIPFDDSQQDSTIWADFQAKVAALALPAEQSAALLSDARNALLLNVKPAYLRLIAELEQQATKASDADGVWRFEHGEEFYAERLRWFTTTDLSASQIHQIGLREVARIQAEMEAIRAQVGFEGDLAAFFVHMREDSQFYYPNTDQGRAEYLAEAKRVIDTMRARLPEMFDLLPEAELVVKRVEPFRERSAGKAFYQGPPPDGSRPGIYYANLYNMADMPKYQLEALAYHEGVPGHHMQIAIAVELDDVPEFQKYTSFTAYTEGWGLYSELVPLEMGFYEDPYSNFGRLAMELWRAARLVVDTGIHSKRWTREQAIAYLDQNTPNPGGDTIKAIERYIAMPGQATAYMIGKLKILALREKAKAALGSEFNIRKFHDLVLGSGRLPLDILELRVDQMIARQPGSQP